MDLADVHAWTSPRSTREHHTKPSVWTKKKKKKKKKKKNIYLKD
jgi:hypothetical protein